MSDISRKISLKYNTMTESQKQVANYFISNTNTIAFKKLDELAVEIGVSTTTIIRFARSLGYNGFADMQQDIQATIIGQMSLPERLHSSDKNIEQNQLFVDSCRNDIENINATLALISSEDLSKMIDTIITAKSIYVLGVRGSLSLAYYLAFRLAQIKKGVRLIQGFGNIYPEEVTSVNKGDVCIAFMFPRYSKITAHLLSYLKKKEVKIILFTDQNSTEISPYGDIILPCSIKGVSYKKSLVAPMSICNYILASVALKDHENAMDMLDQTEEILKDGYFLGL